jgi:hypothetical protein
MRWRRVLGALAALAAVATSLPASADAQADPPTGVCGWPIRDRADLVNVAFPDESAHYWGTLASGIPQTGIVIRGRYPKARYFSLHTYNMTLGAFDGLADHRIEPRSGRNPFVRPPRGADTRRRGGAWEVRIVPGEPPPNPPANTMYTGSSKGVPSLGSIVLYRVYVADDPADPEGSVGLPTVELELGGGELSVRFAGCSLTTLLPETEINELIQQLNWPDGLAIPSPSATDPPEWDKFFGFGGVIANQLGVEELEPMLSAALPAGGFLNNLDNDYMSAPLGREFGEVVVMRAKMPSFPDTRAGRPAWRRSQLRYWSICQNHGLSQRYVDCIADHEAVLGKRRRGTFVISDPENRPRNATREQRVNWLPYGGIYPSGHLIYRQMLASRRFDRALALVQPGEPLEPALGPYLPRLGYCSTERFEQAGARGCLAGG